MLALHRMYETKTFMKIVWFKLVSVPRTLDIKLSFTPGTQNTKIEFNILWKIQTKLGVILNINHIHCAHLWTTGLRSQNMIYAISILLDSKGQNLNTAISIFNTIWFHNNNLKSQREAIYNKLYIRRIFTHMIIYN